MTFFADLKNLIIVSAGTLIILLVGSLWWQTSRLNSAKDQLAEIQRVADEATQQSEANYETIRRAVPAMVEIAQENAVRNYARRYGARKPNPADCPVPAGVQHQSCDSQAPSATVADDACGEPVAPDPEFIQACARDAGRLDLWIATCRNNPLLCEVKP
jgi:hypothetical protein